MRTITPSSGLTARLVVTHLVKTTPQMRHKIPDHFRNPQKTHALKDSQNETDLSGKDASPRSRTSNCFPWNRPIIKYVSQALSLVSLLRPTERGRRVLS